MFLAAAAQPGGEQYLRSVIPDRFAVGWSTMPVECFLPQVRGLAVNSN